ncbi:hypothetical protein [Sorangium cellulosum]|uniref:Secreted protein n=1 Tax=Sorangium cellulosum So0157-2 TaxID=1254432 RepID=S4Y2L8_SORCE|nr:hypothetical protein [Sorangium cellulosum]AGP39742.1 hypothetical protein SCE1572_37755 [Sorangium cellulosum So0157-2]
MRISREPTNRRIAVAIAAAIAAAGCCANPSDDSHAGSGGSPASAGSGGSGGSDGTGASGGGGGSGGDGGGGGAGGSVAPTHAGIISIQDVSILGAPQAGHGLTVQILFTAAKAPSYEEAPGQLTGCKAWMYDVQDDPPPPLTDQGAVTISGLTGGTLDCRFQGNGYVCPAHSGTGEASVTPGTTGTAAYVLRGAALSADDVGRYLRVNGAATAANNGAFPIVAVESSETAIVANPRAAEEAFVADHVVLAGAGPVPNNPIDPIASGDEVVVGIEPGGAMAFEFPDLGPIAAGGEFQLDAASQSILGAVPLDGAPMTLGCAGEGGSCGAAQGTLVRITSTDGDVEGASPFAMPPPRGKQVEIQCVTLGGDGSITVPAEAMKLLQEAHQASSITRIRTAFMREGVASATNPEPQPRNTAHVLAGHGILGFASP